MTKPQKKPFSPIIIGMLYDIMRQPSAKNYPYQIKRST